MKSYTDIEQSRKLAEILPIESADMRYDEYISHIDGTPKVGYKKGVTNGIPCWSLAALLSILPEGIIENYYAPNLQKENGKYSIAYGNEELLCIADNPIDACVEMILNLKENKLI